MIVGNNPKSVHEVFAPPARRIGINRSELSAPARWNQR
jgi:hypothetical protein